MFFLILVGQAWRIMLKPDNQLETKARIQFEQSVEIYGRRGDILARDGTILATSAELLSVHVDPERLNPNIVPTISGRLAPVLDLTPKVLTAKLSRFDRRDVLLKAELTPSEGARLDAVVDEILNTHPTIRGFIWTETEEHRFYPGRHHAAPLIGVIDHQGLGVAGLEQTLNRFLRGQIHRYVLWRDRKGRRVTTHAPPATPGNTVILTLDRAIQHAAETALQDAVTTTGAQAGWAIVMDTTTGEVLAMANYPSHNTNDTSTLDLSALKNRAVADAYEPGSVFKPFVAAAAIEEGLVTPATPINCEGGSWLVGRRVIHDDHAQGVISVAEIIKFSSNIGSVKLAFELGAHRTLGYLRELGFGGFSGLDLPSETRGVVQDPDRIRSIGLATTSYGHGVSVNAIQLASALATLGNEGVKMHPLLVREIRTANNEILHHYKPDIDRRVFSPETARQTLDMMVMVTEEGGTGTRANVPGYLVAGKTGTALKPEDGGYSDTDRIGSFVGIIPADEPRLAIVVTIDTPTIGRSFGGVVAAPAFASIASFAMKHLGIPPDPTLLEPVQSNQTEPTQPHAPLPDAPAEITWTTDGSLRIPNLAGMSLRDALVAMQGTGLSVRMTGSGRVIDQDPSAGTALTPGEGIEVILQ